jgi:hypothetical protein
MDTANQWTGFSNGAWYVWTPPPGLDKSLGEKAMMIGATCYAVCKDAGRPESECQTAAQKGAFEEQYGVKYY